MAACKSLADRCLHGLGLALLLISGAVQAGDALSARLLSLRNLPIPEMPSQKEWKSSSLQKISPTLLEFNEAVSKGPLFSTNLQETAKSLGISYEDDRVAVTLAASNPFEMDALSRSVREMGGEVTITFDHTVFAMIPARSIAGLEQISSLDYAKPQTLYFPTATNRSPGEGGKITGVERLHASGITGKGVKVGIIDWGFQNYQKLVKAGVLPQPKATRAFNQKRNIENDEIHGTACAEIIHSMAPDAELYLASIDGRNDQIMQAAAWLVQQGVNIISFSGGGHGGPVNGTDVLSRYIDKIVKDSGNRLLWVNSAGNKATEHWMGMAVDSNHDNMIDIPTQDDPNYPAIHLKGSQTPMMVVINWDDWGPNPEKPTASIDIDAEIYRFDDNKKPIKVAASTNPQRGRGEPLEILVVKKPEKGKDYFLILWPRKVDRQVKIHVTVSNGLMDPTRAEGSIGSPATARMAFAVGAVDVTNQQLEDYSSQGPTDDGRLKPEISAPDKTLSLAYQSTGEERFPGTSAACPHVSGYSALLKQMQPDISRDDLIRRIIEYAQPMGEGRPNNQFGYGHIYAGRIELAGSGTPPAAGAGNPPPQTGSATGTGRDGKRVLQPILDIMKQNGQ
ncbi:MAG TPA: S8 family serine peptidase [Plasticicumulans sp.]|uniref:S8 family serine peptidase n=1 Tax=Plasticicumulans sp. TaxID=2307179 RepID=UPI002D12FB65|nr:S8 family serine peptidase [Plasticicumulans sp.]HMV37648.1 S8 family serine peptidase [Plasticicumulans sp.]HMW30153.1 S8 family serine peptidase [Plasticicumulans sp.]